MGSKRLTQPFRSPVFVGWYRPGVNEAGVPIAPTSSYTSRMLDWSKCPAVERVQGKVSGEWLFRSSRVPVRALFENLKGGASVVEFLEWFPGVTREQVDAVLEHASQSLAVSA